MNKHKLELTVAKEFTDTWGNKMPDGNFKFHFVYHGKSANDSYAGYLDARGVVSLRRMIRDKNQCILNTYGSDRHFKAIIRDLLDDNLYVDWQLPYKL
jgi:hypothetical protein